jgi:hypothetical protein
MALKTMPRRVTQLGALLAVGLLTTLAVGQPLYAQEGGWTAPELVFEGSGRVDSPVVAADAYGQVHAFWVFSEEIFGAPASRLVYYTRLDDPDWQPLDIYVIDGNGLGLNGAVSGRGLALLWDGGTWAYGGPAPARTAKDWNSPVNMQLAYPNTTMAAAPDGALWMAFGTTTGEIDVQRQDPATGAWEAVKLVGDTANTNAAADWLRLAVGPDGTLHLVWSEYHLPNGWPPLGVYYAQSTDGGETWTDRRRLADGAANQPNIAVDENGAVYVTWTGVAGVGGKFFQESPDGGANWEDVVAILPRGSGGGSDGPPNVVIDSAGGLHMIFANLGCVWYVSRPVDQPWSEPVCISSEAGTSQSIEVPTMTIRLGNELHVLFWTDRRQIWHTSLTLDLPAATPMPLPVQPTTTPAPPTATAVITPTPTPLPDYGPPPTAQMVTGPGLFSIAAGVVPVALIMLLVLAGRRRSPAGRRQAG